MFGGRGATPFFQQLDALLFFVPLRTIQLSAGVETSKRHKLRFLSLNLKIKLAVDNQLLEDFKKLEMSRFLALLFVVAVAFAADPPKPKWPTEFSAVSVF